MILFYRIGKRLPIIKGRYLSNSVNMEKKKILKNSNVMYRAFDSLKPYGMIILFILMITIFLCLIKIGIGMKIVSLFQITSESTINGTLEFLKTSLTIPLAIIGIIIPIIVLVMQNMGTDGDNSIVKSYMLILKPFEVFIVNMICLFLLVIILMFSLHYQFQKNTVDLFTSVALSSIFIPILITTNLVRKSLKLVDDSYLYEIYSREIAKEIRSSLDEELTTILTRRIFKEKCEKNKVIFDHYFISTLNLTPIRSQRNGKIKDINLKQLDKLGFLLKSNDNESRKCYLIRIPEDIISNNNAIGYINFNPEEVSNLETQINNVFIIDGDD